MTEATSEPTRPNPLLRELTILAARYRSDYQSLPTKKELARIKKASGIQTVLITELVEGVRAQDYRRTWDAAQWYARLKIPVPGQLQQDLPQLARECEDAMDAQGIKYKPKNRGVVRRRIVQAGAAAVSLFAIGGVPRVAQEVMNYSRQNTNAFVNYDAKAIFSGPSIAEKYKDAIPPESPLTQEPTEVPPTPTGTPTETPTEIVGNSNMAEFFLGDLLNLFKYRRTERVLFEPGAKERLIPALVNGDQITLLYLGLDETRERKIEFRGNGQGRSDVIMLISFNPHTFKTIAISIPRDMYTPRLGRNKINAMTSGIVRGDIMELSRTIVEELTGVPIDGIIQTNIDTIQGFNGIRSNNYGSEHLGLYYPGIFDVLAPEGIVINVPKTIVDNQYPVGYGTKRLVIPAGLNRMNGAQLTEYARTRHQEMDFGRSNNQRNVLFSLLKVLASDAKSYLLSGDTGKLDLFISFLEREEQNGNIHYNETNFTQVVRTIRDGLAKLSSDSTGKAILGTLALNSVDEVFNLVNNPQAVLTSFGLSFENGMLTPVAPGDTQLKLVGSSMNSSPIEYSQPLRRRVKELFKE